MTTNYENSRSGGNSSFGNDKRPSDIQGEKGKNAPKIGNKTATPASSSSADEDGSTRDRFVEQGGKSTAPGR